MDKNYQLITSIKNPKAQHIKKLKDRGYRKRFNEFIVEGENFVKDIPKDVELTSMFVQEDKIKDFEYIIDRYDERKIFVVDEKVMSVMSDTVTPCGILATVNFKNPNDRLAGNVAVLDGISDPGNMGTIIRTCAACGVENLIAIECADCYSPKVVRASMGGIFKVNVLEKSRSQAIQLLAKHTVYCLDMNGENLYKMGKINHPFALVVGNESKGLSEEFRQAGNIISLPMSGKIESLNAAVSMSVAMYQIIYGKANGDNFDA